MFSEVDFFFRSESNMRFLVMPLLCGPRRACHFFSDKWQIGQSNLLGLIVVMRDALEVHLGTPASFHRCAVQCQRCPDKSFIHWNTHQKLAAMSGGISLAPMLSPTPTLLRSCHKGVPFVVVSPVRDDGNHVNDEAVGDLKREPAHPHPRACEHQQKSHCANTIWGNMNWTVGFLAVCTLQVSRTLCINVQVNAQDNASRPWTSWRGAWRVCPIKSWCRFGRGRKNRVRKKKNWLHFCCSWILKPWTSGTLLGTAKKRQKKKHISNGTFCQGTRDRTRIRTRDNTVDSGQDKRQDRTGQKDSGERRGKGPHRHTDAHAHHPSIYAIRQTSRERQTETDKNRQGGTQTQADTKRDT